MLRSVRALAALIALIGAADASGRQETGGPEVAVTTDGERRTGRLVLRDEGGLGFEPEAGGPAIAADRIAAVVREPAEPGPSAPPPFAVALGHDERIAGRLIGIDGEVRLAVGPGEQEVAVDRGGALSLEQREGEALVLSETFVEVEPEGWRLDGGASGGPTPGDGEPALHLPVDGGTAALTLPEPIDAGRVGLDYDGSEADVEGRRWSVELTFEGPVGRSVARAVLGWEGPMPAVETEGDLTLVVQPIEPGPGRHRLTARFDADRTLLAIDEVELARGPGPPGPLVALRIVAEAAEHAGPFDGPGPRVDDLEVVRFFEPTRGVELDPSQDGLVLVAGDQLWGDLESADPAGVVLRVLDRPVRLPWSTVAAIAFRRSPGPASPVSGPLVRVEWGGGPGLDAAPDRVEGALVGLTADALRIATPHAGTLTIPRDRLRRLEPTGRGRRLVVDPYPRHLGDQVIPELDPPLPDGDRYALSFTLDAVPEDPAALVLDVVQVEGEYEGADSLQELRAGGLRTSLTLNDQAFDYINRHVTRSNRDPIRIRLPLPAGLLREGENTLVFEQAGRSDRPDFRDDLGVLRIALEWPDGGTAEP